jgi:hypothetical protein
MHASLQSGAEDSIRLWQPSRLEGSVSLQFAGSLLARRYEGEWPFPKLAWKGVEELGIEVLAARGRFPLVRNL